MTVYFSPIGNTQTVDDNGDPYVGAYFEVYLAGTTTPAVTWTSATGLVQQPTQITLDASGRPANPIWLTGGQPVKFRLFSPLGSILETWDDIIGVGDQSVTAQSQWVLLGINPTYLSASSFSVPGDQTGTLQLGRRVKTENSGGTVYGTIYGSTFTTLTTVLIDTDSGASLDAGLSSVSYGILSSDETSVPIQYAYYVNVKQWGATGDGTTDDTAKIQNAINANPGKAIFFPAGVYRITAKLSISSDNTRLVGAGSNCTYIRCATADVDGVHFFSTATASAADFVNGVGLVGIYLICDSASTTGAGIRSTQVNGGVFTDFLINNFAEGFMVEGGQLNTASQFKLFSTRDDLSATSRSALMTFKEATLSGGLFQPCFTFEMHQWFASATYKRDAVICVHSGDGITIGSGYGGGGLNAVVLVMSSRNGSYVGPLEIEGAYLDCFNPTTGTRCGVEIRADGNSSSSVYSVLIRGGTIGNGQLVGVLCRKPETYIISIDGTYILNMTSWGVDVEGGTTLEMNVTGCQLQNNGDGSSGGIRAVGGKTLNISGNVFNNTPNVCVSMNGTWNQGVLDSNTNTGGSTPDYGNSATFTNGLEIGANTSAYSGTVANMWTYAKRARLPLAFADDAAAAAGGVQIGMEYVTGSVLKLRIT